VKFEVRNLETLKWVGVVCMLVDHVALYVLHAPTPITEFFGALALPLFATSLGWAVGNQAIGKTREIALRIAHVAAYAQLFVLFVSRVPQATVLATLALGAYLFLVFADDGVRMWKRIAYGCVIAAAASFVEFGWFGVAFVASCCWMGRERSARSFYVAAVLLATLTPYNASYGAIAAIPLIWACSLLPGDLRRVRYVFYAVYVAQFPILWALARALGTSA
jgi:hypothetical protein